MVMNIQEKIQWLENELKELKEEVTEKQEKKENTWKPKNGNWRPELNEEYYFFNGFMEIYGTIWLGTKSDNMRYIVGGCFKTKEDAEFEFERLKVIHELKHFARPYNDDEVNYFICIRPIYGNEVRIECFESRQQNELYFESRENAQKAIYAVGEERIKKYYLQVKED